MKSCCKPAYTIAGPPITGRPAVILSCSHTRAREAGCFSFGLPKRQRKLDLVPVLGARGAKALDRKSVV